ncbi:MAG: RNA polymerase sigma factor [Myxococcales bacterium]|nr:RNA polymerase sigma factor [Myxococcales bacterium]
MLIERIAKGEKDAFRAFYERFAARILGSMLRVTADRETSEELVQEVFLAVWLKAATYRAELGAPEAWLAGIARNKGFDHLRRLQRIGTTIGLEVESLAAPSVEHRADWSIALERATRTLSPEQREAVNLVYGTGHTFQEAARRVGVPTGTLKSRIHTALGVLRSTMKTNPL